MSPLEKTIERAAVKALEARGCLTKKLESLYVAGGWPDRLVVMPNGNRIFFIEFKRPGATTTKLQDHVHKQLRLRGCHVYICTSALEAVEALCAEFDEQHFT